MTALARVKRRCRIALEFSRRSARPETWVNLQRRGVDALRVPRRGNHPEQLPLWEPNGVNPAGSATPSGWRSRLVLKIEGATNNIWTGDGYVRHRRPYRETGEGGHFLRWILRGSGNAWHHGEPKGVARTSGVSWHGANPPPSSRQPPARFPPPMWVWGGFVRVCYRGTRSLEKIILKMSTIICCIFWGVLLLLA